jgi:hypothetical protein
MAQVTEARGSVTESSRPGRILATLITPGQGSSGFYSAEVLQRAVEDGVFPAGTHMYADHPSRNELADRPERSVLHLAGATVEAARWDEATQSVVAEAQLFGPVGAMVREMAEHIGVSIRASADVEEADGQRVISRLIAADSVDFVTRAGRGGRFDVLESARDAMTRELQETTPPPPSQSPVDPAGNPHMEEQNMPEGIEEAERRVTAAEARAQAAEAERDELRGKVALLERRDTARPIIAAVVAEAGSLPGIVAARTVSEALAAVGADMDDTAVRALAEARRDTAAAEVAAIAESLGAGRVRGLGNLAGTGPREVTESELDELQAGIFGRVEG